MRASPTADEICCPACGGRAIPILYGMPSPHSGMMEAAERGEIAIGGCVIPERPPAFTCPNHHEWGAADLDAPDDYR
jgi:hypothetical protein